MKPVLPMLMALVAIGVSGGALAHDIGNVPEAGTQRVAEAHSGAVVLGTTGDGVPIIHRNPTTSHDTASAGAPTGVGPADNPSHMTRQGAGSGNLGFGAPGRVVGIDEGRPVLGHGPHSGL